MKNTVELKELNPNCQDAISWGKHPQSFQGATKATVIFEGGYAYLQVYAGQFLIYENLAG